MNRLSPLGIMTGSSSRSSFLIGRYQSVPEQFALVKKLDNGGFDIFSLHGGLDENSYSLSDVTGPGYDIYLTNVRYTTLSFSIWPLIALFVAPLALLLFRSSVWRSRRSQSLCTGCGYSLVGNTSGVCPECGTAIASVPAPPECGERI